jgi:hypothetical protein
LFIFMNNFCIATCLFSVTKHLRDNTRTWSIYLGYILQGIFLVFTPSVGVKYFWVNLDRIAYRYAYSQCRSSAYVGGVYMILILRAWQTSHNASTKLD